MARVEKLWNPGGGQEMAVMVRIFFNNNTSGQFVSSSQESAQNSPKLLLLKIFAIDRPSQPFLGHHQDFTTFSPWTPYVGLPNWAVYPFYSLTEWLFMSIFHFFCNLTFLCYFRGRKWQWFMQWEKILTTKEFFCIALCLNWNHSNKTHWCRSMILTISIGLIKL